MLRDLNAVAPLITLFFLITYAMINVVVFLEQSMGLVSFRPLFRIPRFVSALGAVGCIFAMFVVNPVFSLVAVTVVLVIHGVLIRRHLEAPFGDVRSGLFVGLAEWAAQKVGSIPASRERVWKANLLVPMENPRDTWHRLGLFRDLSRPNGFIKVLGLTDRIPGDELQRDLEEVCSRLREDGVMASGTVISSASFAQNLSAGVEAFGGTFFRPNVLMLTLPEKEAEHPKVHNVLGIARKERMGTVLLVEAPRGSPYQRESVNVWLRDQGPEWDLSMDVGNQDLAVLLGYKLHVNWACRLRLVALVGDPGRTEAARDYVTNLKALARLPEAEVVLAPGEEVRAEGAPRADFHLIPLPPEPDLDRLARTAEELGSPCLFTLDSGRESALA
jgi:hypothetical protein